MAESLSKLKQELHKLADPKRAEVSQRFFKTGPGQYCEGDVFIGVTVPDLRRVAKHYLGLPQADVEQLLQSKIHEERLIASIILVAQFKKANEQTRKQIYEFYLANTRYINNWDIVDGSAEFIVGQYLWQISSSESPGGTHRSKSTPRLPASTLPRTLLTDNALAVLINLAKSKSVWERRIAMLATFAYIKQGESADAFTIATILLHDEEDLIQKAVGWMLREIGKRDFPVQRSTLSKLPGSTHRRPTTSRSLASASSRSSSTQKCLKGTVLLETFLKQHYQTMPRTMLRYAIEKFPESKHQAYLKGTI